MEEQTITLTETELQSKIDDAVKVATEKLISKHNGEMATIRKSYEDKIKQASMSAEEIAQQKAEELAQAQEQELKELRSYKQKTIITEKLAKAGLPQFLANDSRLLSAEEGKLDNVVKTIKSEYDATRPNGSTISSVVNVGGTASPQKNESDIANEKMSEVIKQALSK